MHIFKNCLLLLKQHLEIVRSKLLCVRVDLLVQSSLSLVVHCARCRFFNCVTDLSSKSRLWWNHRSATVPKQLLLLEHLDVERNAHVICRLHLLMGTWRFPVSPVRVASESLLPM